MAKTKRPKKLNPSEANRLKMDLLVVKIKAAETALKYIFNGKSTLWGQVIDQGYLERLRLQLVELDRVQQVYDSGRAQDLPYLPSGGSVTEKLTDHFDADGRYAFTELRPGQSGKTVATHTFSKSFIKQQIKNRNMATKKKAAKKGATKKAVKKTSTKQEGTSIKAFVDACVKKKMDNAAIFAALDKEGYAYSINSVRWYASKARA